MPCSLRAISPCCSTVPRPLMLHPAATTYTRNAPAGPMPRPPRPMGPSWKAPMGCCCCWYTGAPYGSAGCWYGAAPGTGAMAGPPASGGGGAFTMPANKHMWIDVGNCAADVHGHALTVPANKSCGTMLVRSCVAGGYGHALTMPASRHTPVCRFGGAADNFTAEAMDCNNTHTCSISSTPQTAPFKRRGQSC